MLLNQPSISSDIIDMSDIENLEGLTESDFDNIVASPLKKSESCPKSKLTSHTTSVSPDGDHGSKHNNDQDIDSSLHRELENLRRINKVIENTISSLECAKGNVDTVSRTVNSASTLLDTWVKILSQTEHNQRLILNTNWKGASTDIANMENESLLKAQAEEKRAADEERRKEDLRKREEDEERQRQAGTSIRSVRGSSSRLRGSRRGISNISGHATGASSTIQGSARGSQIGRTRSGIGRGFSKRGTQGAR